MVGLKNPSEESILSPFRLFSPLQYAQEGERQYYPANSVKSQGHE